MSYKLDKKKSNKFSKFLIASGIAVALIGQGYAGITIFSQLEGVKTNDTIITQVITDKQADTKAQENNNNNNIDQDINQEEYIPKYDINELQQQYPNAWGILEKPNGTAFPIAATNSREEEDYYLTHTLDGNYSSSGTVFLDHQNDKDMNNQVSRIWGHNLLGENMFGDLTEYQNQGQNFYDQNKTYTLYTAKGVYQLDVFAALEEDGTTQEFDYNNQETFLEDMYNNINASNFTSDVTIEPDNQVIILECCPDRGSAFSGNNRFAVYTKITPIYEYDLSQNKTL